MNKASGDDDLFQILKDDAVKVLYSMCQQIWKTQQWPQDSKGSSFHSNPKESQCQRMFKLLHNCTHLTCQQSNAKNSLRQASIVHELRTSRCPCWIQKRQRNQGSSYQHLLGHRKKHGCSGKASTSASLTTLKPLTVQITTNSRKYLKRWECQTT